MKGDGFAGRADEAKGPYCLRPGFEVGNACRYPWWTMLIRVGTLWRCGHCNKLSVLEWIDAGGWGMKSWQAYKGDDA